MFSRILHFLEIAVLMSAWGVIACARGIGVLLGEKRVRRIVRSQVFQRMARDGIMWAYLLFASVVCVALVFAPAFLEVEPFVYCALLIISTFCVVMMYPIVAEIRDAACAASRRYALQGILILVVLSSDGDEGERT